MSGGGADNRSRRGRSAEPPTAITPAWKYAFFDTVALTVLSLAASVGLVLWGPKGSEAADPLVETCSTTWKMGFGAIIGLVGGKAL